MNTIIKNNNYYISYKGRNEYIKLANNILHKIKSEYDSASPYKVYLLSEKHQRPMSCRNLTNNKLFAFRRVQKEHMKSDLEYTKTILDVFKQARAANCKEYDELAFIYCKT